MIICEFCFSEWFFYRWKRKKNAKNKLELIISFVVFFCLDLIFRSRNKKKAWNEFLTGVSSNVKIVGIFKELLYAEDFSAVGQTMIYLVA